MITLSTAELLGMIGDMLPFVDPDKDSTAHHCIRIEQKGDTLTMLATNRAQAFRVGYVAESAAGITLEEFDVRISPVDAKAIVSAFKLGIKLEHAPVTLRVRGTSARHLVVSREREEEAWSALTMHVTAREAPNLEAGDSPEIDIHQVVGAASRAHVNMVPAIAWSPRLLANLGKVERHGEMVMAFTSTRDGAPVYVQAGERFDGIMYPVKREREDYRPGAVSDVLRTGSGLLVSVDDVVSAGAA